MSPVLTEDRQVLRAQSLQATDTVSHKNPIEKASGESQARATAPFQPLLPGEHANALATVRGLGCKAPVAPVALVESHPFFIISLNR